MVTRNRSNVTLYYIACLFLCYIILQFVTAEEFVQHLMRRNISESCVLILFRLKHLLFFYLAAFLICRHYKPLKA